MGPVCTGVAVASAGVGVWTLPDQRAKLPQCHQEVQMLLSFFNSCVLWSEILTDAEEWQMRSSHFLRVQEHLHPENIDKIINKG